MNENTKAMCERLRLPLMYDTNISAVTANINIANHDRRQAADKIERLTAELTATKAELHDMEEHLHKVGCTAANLKAERDEAHSENLEQARLLGISSEKELRLLADRDRLREALEKLRRGHYDCEDCWYSCPKSGECCNENLGDECNCGADAHNAIIDAALEGTK